jgi:hypothetical protein
LGHGDLADDEGVAQIFIRCPGHLWGDDKFGQIGGAGNLAGAGRFADGNRSQASGARRSEAGGTSEDRLSPRRPHPRDPAMPTADGLLPLTATARTSGARAGSGPAPPVEAYPSALVARG